MGYKNKDEVPSLDDLELPKSLVTFIEELPERYSEGKMNPRIEKQISREWYEFKNRQNNDKPKHRKKILSISLSIAVACTLFISLAFTSPAFAHMVSAIPYLNLIFENKIDAKPLRQEITDALQKNKYRTSIAVDVSIKDQKVELMVIDTEDYYNQVKSPLETLIKNILKSRNEEEYKVKILYDAKLTQALLKETPVEIDEEMEKASNIAYQVLEKYGYPKEKVAVGISSNGKINLEHIPSTEKKIDEIKNEILNNLKQENIDHYTIKAYTYDPLLEDRGSLVRLSDTIANGLMAKKEFKVDSVGSSNKYKDYFYIVIRTTISKGDSDESKVVDNIEKTVTEFLTSKDALSIIQNDKYKVLIESKDGEELKTLTN